MILERVSAYITEKQLITKGRQVIVGLSGGADSVALTDILTRLGYKVIAAHCNFQLRGEESERDAKFAEQLCLNNGIEFHNIKFDTKAYARRHKKSIEMAARELRYTWFGELSVTYRVQHIAVAHHQDDSVETVLLNLTRGTGIRGLTGILPANGKIIRPLLCLSRKEILEYINERGLTYVTDGTNNETHYTRNKIRLEIIPMLETINPSVKETILRTSENLSQAAAIYNKYIEQCAKTVKEGDKIKINELLKVTESQAVLYEMLTPYGFNRASVKQIYETINRVSGKKFYSATHQLVKDRENFIINELKSDNEPVYNLNQESGHIGLPLSMNIETVENTPGFEIEKNKQQAYLDKDKLRFPLTIRRWQQGDWFIPFGMKGRKKLSDYFTDQKLTVFDKEKVWILTSGEEIVWIVGHRTDDRFKITPTTKKILKISLEQ